MTGPETPSTSPPSPEPGLQRVPADARPTASCAELVCAVLDAERPVGEVCGEVAAHFLGTAGVDFVLVALTLVPPEDRDDWIHLGDRVWLREWNAPGATCSSVPGGDRGPEGALTMPWLSLRARDDVVAIHDREQLPPEARQDRSELELCQVRALVNRALMRDGDMYGSLSVARGAAGPWPREVLADFRLVSVALTARMAEEHLRRTLADAVAVGDQARLAQQQFFATVGHELRTPISAVIGYAEMMVDEAGLAREPGDGDFREAVARDAQVVLRAAEQLLAIVEDLLSTGRTLGQEESRNRIGVSEAVADVLHWHRTTAERAGVTLSSTVPPGSEVVARPSGVRQVLTNLVGNAIVHNRRGGTVEVGAQPLVGEGGQRRVRITVRDSGRGLSETQLRAVFEPFVRFAGPQVRGTGLGLPLARTVAERDGGQLGAESVPGDGSVFWVDLPAG